MNCHISVFANIAGGRYHHCVVLISAGECWTGNNGDYSYDRDGSSKNCIDKCYEPCKPYEKYCSGKQFANYVYRLSGPGNNFLVQLVSLANLKLK